MALEIPDKKYDIIFTIGRMNPPTTGHIGLINKMKEMAKMNGLKDIFIILSHSHDNSKNPLSCNTKREFLKIMNESTMSDINVHLLCMDDPIFQTYGSNKVIAPVLYLVNSYNPGKMLMIIGEDRGNAYGWIKNILENPENPKPVGLDFNVLARPKGAMSATQIRDLVRVNIASFNKFVELQMETGLSKDKAIELFTNIQMSFLKPNPKSKSRKRKAQPRKGGRKTRRKKLKKRRKRKTKKSKNSKK